MKVLIGDRLKALRQISGLTQEEIVQQISITASALSYYENNIREPPLDVLKLLAQIYHTSVDYILGNERENIIVLDGYTLKQQEIIRQIVDLSGRLANLEE